MKRILTTLIGVVLVVACFCTPLAVFADTTPTNGYFYQPQIRYAVGSGDVDWGTIGIFPTNVTSTSMVRDYVAVQYGGQVGDLHVNKYAINRYGRRIGDSIRLYPTGENEITQDSHYASARFEFTINNMFLYTDATVDGYPFDDYIPSLTLRDVQSAVTEAEDSVDGVVNARLNIQYLPKTALLRKDFTKYQTYTQDIVLDSTTPSTYKIRLLPDISALDNAFVKKATLTIDGVGVVYGGAELNLYYTTNDTARPGVSQWLYTWQNAQWLDTFQILYGGDYTEEVVDFEDISWTDWLGNAIGGVFDTPLFGGATLGTVLGICVAIGVMMFILKKFAGG